MQRCFIFIIFGLASAVECDDAECVSDSVSWLQLPRTTQNQSKSVQISQDQPKPVQISSNQPRSPQISPDHPKSAESSTDQPKSAKINPDHAKSAEISPDHPRSAQINPLLTMRGSLHAEAYRYSKGYYGLKEHAANISIIAAKPIAVFRAPFYNPSLVRIDDTVRRDLVGLPSETSFLAVGRVGWDQCSTYGYLVHSSNLTQESEAKTSPGREIVALDGEMRVLSAYPLDLHSFSRRFHWRFGATDASLHVIASKLWIAISSRAYPAELSQLHFDASQFYVDDATPHQSVEGSSLAFLIKEAQTYVVSWAYPFEIHKLDMEMINKQIKRVRPGGLLKQREEEDLHHVRSNDMAAIHGNPVTLLYLPSHGVYLGVAHMHRDFKPKTSKWHSHYSHMFYVAKGELPNVTDVGWSDEFCFQSAGRQDDCDEIQFISSLIAGSDPSTIILTYGLNDCEGIAVQLKVDDIMNRIKFNVGHNQTLVAADRNTQDAERCGGQSNAQSQRRGIRVRRQILETRTGNLSHTGT
eukprot:gnl/TRDRNA2_/TRDRNA2_153142_c0_seq2.p1 gnl/TRDRNA2_/TRDRNA2_153142_c0~~gnl/TRDRNA2_/TRDRNA2_153142_c0_seq2.p1  ORF type:complete len:525 (-),score=27.93 gnl/TRDRNA2_/TRDRNA2_153142_c0_seq2:135-1709(-)